MKRISLLALVSLSLSLSAPVSGQESDVPAHVYEAFYRIGMADLAAWNESYFEHSVPILEELQEKGLIEGFGQHEHHTGGHYNIRFVVRTYDWAAIETFWNEYIARLSELTSWSNMQRMMREHDDQIWDIGEVNVPDGFEPAFLYAAKFSLNFADMDEWNTMWSEAMAGFIEEAAEEDVRVGFVRLDHNTGGPHNSKHLFLFEDWDDIDDFIFGRVLAKLAEEDPDVWERLLEIMDSHDDVVWVPSTRH